MTLRSIPALGLCLLLSVGLLAAPPQTKITVTVKNPHDKPVDNAAVVLDFLGSHQITKLGKRKPVHWEVHTNQDGIAHFPPVPQGTIQIQVIAKNYQTYGNKFDIDSEEKTIDIQLNPPQPQYSAHPPLKPAETPKQ
jgi:Carboxypeptidase regulatory-like domain